MQVYTYDTRGPAGLVAIIWRLPLNASDDSPTLAARNVSTITVTKHEQYATRHVRTMFVKTFSKVVPTASKAMLRLMYSYLSNDSAVADQKVEAAKHVLSLLMDSGGDFDGSSILLDARVLNQGRQSQFETFWDECGKVLEGRTGVQQRRHGSTQFMSVATSTRHLVELTCASLQARVDDPEDSLSVMPLIPSMEWVRLQFTPLCMLYNNSIRHTGRYDVCFRMQSRNARVDHIDGRFCIILKRYMNEWCLLYRDYAEMIMTDDKQSIEVGKPGFPVATVERGKRVLSVGLHSDTKPTSVDGVYRSSNGDAMDHNAGHTFSTLVTSVTLIPNLDDDANSSSLATGQVYVTLKEAVWSPSSALRHAAEDLQILRLHRAGSDLKPILCLYTDGGPDHKPSNPKTQMALFAKFRNGNFDVLTAARTAPYNSYMNPVERQMSILNMGLSGATIMRERIKPEHPELATADDIAVAEDMEQVQQQCSQNTAHISWPRLCTATQSRSSELMYSFVNYAPHVHINASLQVASKAKTVAELRKAAQRFPEGHLASAWHRSHAALMTALMERFRSLESQGVPYREGVAATDEQLSQFFAPAAELLGDSDLKFDDVSRAKMEQCERYR